MDVTGLVLVLAGALICALGAFVARPRAPRAVAAGLLSVGGVVVGAGALLLEERDANAVNWLVTLGVLAVVSPVHAALLFGPPRAGAVR